MRIHVSNIVLTGAIALSLLLGNCANNQRKTQSSKDSPTVETTDIHNSRNSLDYQGTYSGILPCTDCSGIKVELTLLPQDKYTLKYSYETENKEKNVSHSGVFTWNNTGNIITLDYDTLNRYQVGENLLFALNEQGERITGEEAGRYILTKK